MRWSCLQFNVLRLPESYRRLPAETRGKPLSPSPLHGQGASSKTILPGRWYEIKQKQQKMPKARANITVYSSRRFSGSSLILSCLTVSFSCGIVYSRVKRTPESEKRQMSVYLIKRKIKKKMLVYVPGTYIPGIPFSSSTRRRCEL